jgi:HupE/UreJ protein
LEIALRARRPLAGLVALFAAAMAAAHGVSGDDAHFVAGVHGVAVGPFAYLGAKHMVTGYDHLLFLAGVLFFLRRLRDVAVYGSLFALGHTITLLGAVLLGWKADAFLVDAVIGLSVAYKAFENLGGFARMGLFIPPRAAVFAFGLCHGLGLATKLQELSLSREGLAANLVAFNIGVELGELCALTFMVLLFTSWRARPAFLRQAWTANTLLMAAGFLLCAYQLTGYFLGSPHG